MRLQVSFLALLLTASLATSLVWRELSSAREGDLAARFVVFTLVPIALFSIILLGRIVLTVKSGRQLNEEK